MLYGIKFQVEINSNASNYKSNVISYFSHNYQ